MRWPYFFKSFFKVEWVQKGFVESYGSTFHFPKKNLLLAQEKKEPILEGFFDHYMEFHVWWTVKISISDDRVS